MSGDSRRLSLGQHAVDGRGAPHAPASSRRHALLGQGAGDVGDADATPPEAQIREPAPASVGTAASRPGHRPTMTSWRAQDGWGEEAAARSCLEQPRDRSHEWLGTHAEESSPLARAVSDRAT